MPLILTPLDVAHLPLDFALYLPESWLTDARRAEARIPWNIEHATKAELALEMISRAVDDKIQPGLVLADQAYGGDEFRQGIRKLGLHYAIPTDPRSMVVTLGKVTFAMRLFNKDYFVVLALKPEGNLGRARYELRKAELGLAQEFSL